MSWLLLGVGLLALALGVNVLWPRRSLLGLAFSFVAQWLVAELAHWTLIAFGAGVAVLVAAGGLDRWPGWVGAAAALVGMVLIAIEVVLAWRSRPAISAAFRAAGLPAPTPDRGQWRRLLVPFWLGDRRVERIGNLRYADGAGRRHLADVYRAKASLPARDGRPAPVLLQVHGGAWMVSSKRQQGRPLVNRMAAHGWLCVAINYRLAPKAKMPAQLVDVKLALAWIKAHISEYGGDPARIVVTGGSAGGHLAALAALTMNDARYQPGFGTEDTSVVAAVPLYPPTDLVPLFDFRRARATRWANRRAALVFGASPTADPERFREWSPVQLVTAGLVPFLVVQGSADNLVPPAQTRAFAEKLRAIRNQRAIYLELPGAPHAFDVFHSMRAEAAVGAIHTFCDWVIADLDASGGSATDPTTTRHTARS